VLTALSFNEIESYRFLKVRYKCMKRSFALMYKYIYIYIYKQFQCVQLVIKRFRNIWRVTCVYCSIMYKSKTQIHTTKHPEDIDAHGCMDAELWTEPDSIYPTPSIQQTGTNIYYPYKVYNSVLCQFYCIHLPDVFMRNGFTDLHFMCGQM